MNKIWLGGVTAFLFCGIIAANSLLFPSVLAVTGESNEVQSVNVEELSALVESDADTESEINGVNMISEKKAVELARKAVNESGYDVDVSEYRYNAQLIEDVAPLDSAIWCIFFCEVTDEKELPQKSYSIAINAKTSEAYTALEFNRLDDSSDTKIGYNITWADLSEDGRSRFVSAEVYGNDGTVVLLNIFPDEHENSDVNIYQKFGYNDSLEAGRAKFGLVSYTLSDGSNDYYLFSPYFFTTELSEKE